MMMDNAASIKEQEIQSQADALIVAVKESYLNGTGIHEIEKNLFEALLKMGHQALGLLFDLCGSGDVGQRVCLDNGREVNRLAVPHVKPYLSIFGHRWANAVAASSQERSNDAPNHSLY